MSIVSITSDDFSPQNRLKLQRKQNSYSYM